MTSDRDFQHAVWEYYDAHRRDMPWRTDHSPYRVLVSELMLQQTQAPRVEPKFTAFMAAFPTVEALADSSLNDVLAAWQGLGYNRRAKFLHEAAKAITKLGYFPDTLEGLVALPGVGKNTAGAILAYAFDRPVVYVETNIRTVLFHHFFDGQADVSDSQLLEIMQANLPEPEDGIYREWYWAVMDYGTYLKKTAGGRLDQSRHYKKQVPLKGSIREIRGRAVKALVEKPLTENELKQAIGYDERYEPAIEGLIRDGLIERKNGTISVRTV